MVIFFDVLYQDKTRRVTAQGGFFYKCTSVSISLSSHRFYLDGILGGLVKIAVGTHSFFVKCIALARMPAPVGIPCAVNGLLNELKVRTHSLRTCSSLA